MHIIYLKWIRILTIVAVCLDKDSNKCSRLDYTFYRRSVCKKNEPFNTDNYSVDGYEWTSESANANMNDCRMSEMQRMRATIQGEHLRNFVNGAVVHRIFRYGAPRVEL